MPEQEWGPRVHFEPWDPRPTQKCPRCGARVKDPELHSQTVCSAAERMRHLHQPHPTAEKQVEDVSETQGDRGQKTLM